LIGYVKYLRERRDGRECLKANEHPKQEFLGGENFRVQSNYFGKADTTTYDRMVYVPVADPQNQFHTYSVNWTSAAITWLVDGAPVRTLNYADAQGGTRFPQTPMRFRIGSWVGGDPSNGKGTIDWAGGLADYSKVPWNMYIESVNIVNYSPASQYKYKDNSGSWQSIDIIGGSAGGIEDPSKNPPQSSKPLSTSGVSTGSRIPPLPIETSKVAAATLTSQVTKMSAAPTAHTDGIQSNSNVTTGLPKPASATSAKPSQATGNAAAGFSGMREMASLSMVSLLFFAFF
jgi:beta-glucanase (GH16 family)